MDIVGFDLKTYIYIDKKKVFVATHSVK